MIKLYSYFRSSASYRVRIGLNLKQVEYEIVPIHLVNNGGEQFSEDYSKINPANRVPTLDHDGFLLAQSVAIFEYLDDVFPENPLLPNDPKSKAHCRQLMEIINADIQPIQNLSVLKKLVKDHGLSEQDKIAWIQHWINLGFNSYETLANKTAGKFSVGDNITAADCFLVPQIYNAERFDVDMKQFPAIQKIYENVKDLPAFVEAHPSQHQ